MRVQRGFYRMRCGAVAEVQAYDEGHPYPWYGVLPGLPDEDGWDRCGRSWSATAYDLVERVTKAWIAEEYDDGGGAALACLAGEPVF